MGIQEESFGGETRLELCKRTKTRALMKKKEESLEGETRRELWRENK